MRVSFLAILCCMWMILGLQAPVSVAVQQYKKSKVERIQGAVGHVKEMGKLAGYVSVWSIMVAMDTVRAKIAT